MVFYLGFFIFLCLFQQKAVLGAPIFDILNNPPLLQLPVFVSVAFSLRLILCIRHLRALPVPSELLNLVVVANPMICFMGFLTLNCLVDLVFQARLPVVFGWHWIVFVLGMLALSGCFLLRGIGWILAWGVLWYGALAITLTLNIKNIHQYDSTASAVGILLVISAVLINRRLLVHSSVIYRPARFNFAPTQSC